MHATITEFLVILKTYFLNIITKNNYKFDLPKPFVDPGGFGTIRKYDIHTGIDLYCQDGDSVFAIEDGVVIAIEDFTGESAGSPWWEQTQAVVIKSGDLIWLYGEITTDLIVGQKMSEGQIIGKVKRVLKKDKQKTPTSMLHIELYNNYNGSVIWEHNKLQPYGLLDPTNKLLEL